MGELRLLTKASYVSIFVVPLLASLMPLLGPAYDQLVQGYSQLSESIQTGISTQVQETRTPSKPIDGFPEDRATDQPTVAPLPNTLAFAFFSALFVVLGHVFYQAYSPSLIRKMRLEDLLSNARTAFLQSPEERPDLVREAKFHLKKHARNTNCNPSLFLRHDQLVWLPNNFSTTRGGSGDPLNMPPHFSRVEDGRPRANTFGLDEQLGLIELGAIAEYRNEAHLRTVAVIVCLVFYFAAILLILILIAYQSLRVADAACWDIATHFVDIWPDAVPNSVSERARNSN
ncbi:MAG: hypothetical protein AAFU85_15115 [Planctomycetota bacterium]